MTLCKSTVPCLWCELREKTPVKKAVVEIVLGFDIMPVCKDCQHEIIELVDMYTTDEEFEPLNILNLDGFSIETDY